MTQRRARSRPVSRPARPASARMAARHVYLDTRVPAVVASIVGVAGATVLVFGKGLGDRPFFGTWLYVAMGIVVTTYGVALLIDRIAGARMGASAPTGRTCILIGIVVGLAVGAILTAALG